MESLLKKAFYFGLGAMSITREKAEKLINELVERGEMSKEEAKQFIDEALKKGEEEKEALRRMIREEFFNLKNDVAVATKAELEALEARIKALEDRLQ
ncbi:Polyhydroxyalkanoate synthesis regulator phasin [Thermosyntropha lipolytica DSM 11003]|uniref:Polyhydroxyalkanoate synthesis regulator phasin n=1 Tax=Thermosyntropha lipolytica DSM 11003 TaxID=1123382 RepID=A0A1M5L6N1_9FIRM|nr:hypothetical protein [Thermosyntropha lipolytica]SHG60688.1 Polyhydroxyalkanoate synthesis regulator phasin [Thermosyntropha lipolytica DSM 11003]